MQKAQYVITIYATHYATYDIKIRSTMRFMGDVLVGSTPLISIQKGSAENSTSLIFCFSIIVLST